MAITYASRGTGGGGSCVWNPTWEETECCPAGKEAIWNPSWEEVECH